MVDDRVNDDGATGAVRFRMFSSFQTGSVASLFHRVGFRFVGRRLQAQIAIRTQQMMQRLTTGALATPTNLEHPSRAAGH